jgi:hypothetical protein
MSILLDKGRRNELRLPYCRAASQGHFFGGGFTGTSTTAGLMLACFHSSNDSVTRAIPLPTD